ncbi:hypothetical protein BV898_10143 [Hypsibius exemplaris]|uniref:Uncharacterized protein n=1 Tax=Hypsibius exemplaris TaxID=2072580 RepID=A0A1W0WKG2_HYPEX|nr:hypothetical protein BV898_10143 [Hypsibius exemplaris]
MTCDEKCLCYLAAAYNFLPTVVFILAAVLFLYISLETWDFGSGNWQWDGANWSPPPSQPKSNISRNCGIGAAVVAGVSLAGTVCLIVGLVQASVFSLMAGLFTI